jgi:hypothetical protein
MYHIESIIDSLFPDIFLISKAVLISWSETATALLHKYASVKSPFEKETSQLYILQSK